MHFSKSIMELHFRYLKITEWNTITMELHFRYLKITEWNMIIYHQHIPPWQDSNYSCTQILFSVIFIPRKPWYKWFVTCKHAISHLGRLLLYGSLIMKKTLNTSIVMIVFDGIPCQATYCDRFLESHSTNMLPEKALFVLVTVYNTNLSSQWKLTVQIKLMQDKMIFLWKRNGKRTITPCSSIHVLLTLFVSVCG